MEPRAESTLQGGARGGRHPLLRASLFLRQPAATDGRERDRLHRPGARGDLYRVLLQPPSPQAILTNDHSGLVFSPRTQHRTPCVW